MDFLSWSSSLFKLNGYEATQNQQHLQQQAGLLSSCWPWISEQPSATRPTSLILDLALLEAAAVNHFWHPTSLILDLALLEAAAVNHFWHPAAAGSSLANFMSSTIMDKQNQLSFGIDRILGNQIGGNQATLPHQVS